jgi:hypothetical protein
MIESTYGDIFRDAYATLHGGRSGEFDDGSERNAAEPVEVYLARTRVESLGVMRKRLLASEPPPDLQTAHQLLVDLLTNAALADEALAAQVRAYQCGQFHESVAQSDRLQELVVSSQRIDRDLIAEIRGLPDAVRWELAIDV